MRGARDACAVESLAGAVLHAGPQHQRELGAQLLDLRLDVLDAQRFFAGARLELDQRRPRRRACATTSCPRMACRSDENAPASISTLSRMPTGR